MRRRKLLRSVYPYYLAVIVVSLLLAGLYSSRQIREAYLEETGRTLEARARMLGELLAPLIADSDNTAIDRQCKELGRFSGTRITVVDAAGVVLGDSDEDPRSMENHGRRPEIVGARTTGIGVETRFSSTRRVSMMYVAVPIESDGETIGVVRTSYPVTNVRDTLHAFYEELAVGGMIIIFLTTVLSLVVFRRLTRPLKELQEGAERFAQGNFGSKLAVPDTAEMAALAESLNAMAVKLDAHIRTIVKQRNEREAVLAGMSEGVMALDADENIISLNRAAARFLGIDPKNVTGKPIQEAVRIAGLHDLVERALKTSEKIEMEIVPPNDRDRCLQVRGTSLSDADSRLEGVVLAFSDITRLKKLEVVRRDFVANVSHELKTPITAIAASVETLLDGAMNSPEDSRRFLEMIAEHADRLNNLVEDLLSMARIESESERQEIELRTAGIAGILEKAVQAYREMSSLHQVEVLLRCDPDLEAKINSTHLEQAVTNLLDNAIKYSNPGTTVTVGAEQAKNEVVIFVQDQGLGIEARHLPRIFERFYRIDRARSRDAGGTGLGLAIVKHVALAHRGRVTVESRPGEGSTFRIHLPKAR